MRSPKLYEHLRKQKVLILPSRTCLQRYTRSFKSGFGFNSAVFNALATKTRDMDISSRHGGIIFDEIKLAEHFSVNAVGKHHHFFNRASDHWKCTTFARHRARFYTAEAIKFSILTYFQGQWKASLTLESSPWMKIGRPGRPWDGDDVSTLSR